MNPEKDSDKMSVLSQLLAIVREISGLPECRSTSKKMYYNLVRRIKLLSPLFEELKDGEEELEDSEIQGFESLRVALDSAKELLKLVNEGSKLYQVYVCPTLCLVAEQIVENK